MQNALKLYQSGEAVLREGVGIEAKDAFHSANAVLVRFIEKFPDSVQFSWHEDLNKRGWDNERAILVVSYGQQIHIPLPLSVLEERGLTKKVRNAMNEFYALNVHPKEMVTFLDADTREWVTRPQGLDRGVAVLMRLLPRVDEAEAKRILTDGGLIEGLDFRAAWNVQFELDKFEAQYVKSTIKLTVSPAEALAAINRPAKGDICCNNDWGKGFIANPFEVARWIFEAPDEVKVEPFASPDSLWSVRRGDRKVTLWHYHSGTKEVEFEVDGMQGMTWVRYDHELFFLVLKAIEAVKPNTI